MRVDPVKLPLTTVVDGRAWGLYSIEYKTADGTFCTYIYAISDEHAAAIVQELKESACVVGRLVGWDHAGI